MRRGELWAGSGGIYSRKPRPVLIIQDDLYATEYSIIVLPITSVLRSAGLTRYHLSPHPVNGLRQDSDVQIDKIPTLEREHLTERIGEVDKRDLREIERLIPSTGDSWAGRRGPARRPRPRLISARDSTDRRYHGDSRRGSL